MKKDKEEILVMAAIIICITGFFTWKSLTSVNIAPATHIQPADQTPIIKKNYKNPTSNVPKIKYPIELFKKEPSDSQMDSEPIPKIEESDQNFEHWAKVFFGKFDFSEVLTFKNLIRNVVVVVENASDETIPMDMSPIKVAPGKLVVKPSGKNFELQKENFKRYARYMDLANAADLKKIVSYYRHMYPLFQSAYKDLGRDEYFNDKLIEMLDMILATPEQKKPIQLFYTSSQYQFVDSTLESLPAIQKILLRMGPDNSKILKSRIKELRKLLTN